MTQRLPPFARRIVDMRRRGFVPTSGQIAIAVGAWDYVHREREDAVVLPPNEDPAGFDWRFVAGLPVLLIVGEKHLTKADQLAQLVIAAGCFGCAALITPKFGSKLGWKLYRSHFEELRHAA